MSRGERGQGTLFRLIMKDLSVLQILFPSGDLCIEVEGAIRRGATVDSVENLFAFEYDGPEKGEEAMAEGWGIFSVNEELARMGLPDTKFRLSTLNEDFSLCASYPRLIAVPAALDDDTLREVAKFRQFDRLPMLRLVLTTRKYWILVCRWCYLCACLLPSTNPLLQRSMRWPCRCA
jgi:hypothetical protein